jgi:hypothetical protein
MMPLKVLEKEEQPNLKPVEVRINSGKKQQCLFSLSLFNILLKFFKQMNKAKNK